MSADEATASVSVSLQSILEKISTTGSIELQDIKNAAKTIREGAAAIQALSHALITLAATTRLICIDTRHPMPKENLGVAAEALRKAGYNEAAEQVGK